MDLRFQVSYEKATQALNFMATKDGGRISKLKAIKLIFLADRYHLRKYGRPVVGDQYFAMEHADFFRDPDPQDPRLSTVGYRDFFSEVIDEEQKESAREIAEEETRICSLWR